MFPIKWSDFFRKKDGNLVFMDEMGGGSVKWMSQSEWDELTFEEKSEAGFTAIGSQGTPAGKFYDFSDIQQPWYYDTDIDNVVNMLVEDGFNFHGFASETSGDAVSSEGRGVTRTSNDRVFICNFLDINGYGSFIMFGSSAAALSGGGSYYSVRKILNRDLYAGALYSGAWSSNTDITFTHNGVTQKLQTYYPRLTDCTISGITYSGEGIVIPSTYDLLLSSIIDFLTNQ